MGNQYSYTEDGEAGGALSGSEGGAIPVPVPDVDTDGGQSPPIPIPMSDFDTLNPAPDLAGSAPESISAPDGRLSGTVHTRTQSFDVLGDNTSPVYKLARLSLRPDDDPSEPDTLATIGDSPRSDVSGAFPADPDAAAELERPRPVPTVINWRHPGVQVVLTGDFNGWTQDSLMQKDGNEFWSVLNLTPGTYHYKFVVDGEWMYAPDHATARDARGNMSNYIHVEPWVSTVEHDLVTPPSPRDSYAQIVPGGEDFYTKEPPATPSHLTASLSLPMSIDEIEQQLTTDERDSLEAPYRALPTSAAPPARGGSPERAGRADRNRTPAVRLPSHVLLNHLYHGVARDGGEAAVSAGGKRGDAPRVFTVTTRYVDKGAGDKYVANVFYTP